MKVAQQAKSFAHKKCVHSLPEVKMYKHEIVSRMNGFRSPPCKRRQCH